MHFLGDCHLPGLVLPLGESLFLLRGVVPYYSFKHLETVLVLLKRDFFHLRDSLLLFSLNQSV